MDLYRVEGVRRESFLFHRTYHTSFRVGRGVFLFHDNAGIVSLLEYRPLLIPPRAEFYTQRIKGR
jgi:hypothetical protein